MGRAGGWVGLGGGPAGIRGTRGAACAHGLVRSAVSRVGPGAEKREGRGGGAGRGPPTPKPGARPPAPPGGEWQDAFERWRERGLPNPGANPASTWGIGPRPALFSLFNMGIILAETKAIIILII